MASAIDAYLCCNQSGPSGALSTSCVSCGRIHSGRAAAVRRRATERAMPETESGYDRGARTRNSCLPVGNREAYADCQGGELIDRVAAGAPIGKLLLVEAIGHMRLPFAKDRPDHGSGIELTA